MTIFDQKLEHSIQLLRKSESLALRYSDDGFFLAFIAKIQRQSIVDFGTAMINKGKHKKK